MLIAFSVLGKFILNYTTSSTKIGNMLKYSFLEYFKKF